MLLYHGSYVEIKTPKILAGKYAKDFGLGFYCTILKEQAVRWASRYNSPILNIYEYEENSSLKIRDFAEMTEEWLDFVTHQITFCNERALESLKFIKSEALK